MNMRATGRSATDHQTHPPSARDSCSPTVFVEEGEGRREVGAPRHTTLDLRTSKPTAMNLSPRRGKSCNSQECHSCMVFSMGLLVSALLAFGVSIPYAVITKGGGSLYIGSCAAVATTSPLPICLFACFGGWGVSCHVVGHRPLASTAIRTLEPYRKASSVHVLSSEVHGPTRCPKKQRGAPTHARTVSVPPCRPPSIHRRVSVVVKCFVLFCTCTCTSLTCPYHAYFLTILKLNLYSADGPRHAWLSQVSRPADTSVCTPAAHR